MRGNNKSGSVDRSQQYCDSFARHWGPLSSLARLAAKKIREGLNVLHLNATAPPPTEPMQLAIGEMRWAGDVLRDTPQNIAVPFH